MFGHFVRKVTGSFGGVKPKYKFVVVGNCQTRPLARIISLLSSDVQVIAIAIVHLLQSEEYDKYIPYFKKADFIVAQLVSDNYPCDFVRTQVLKDLYGRKLITIVNLYYKGYNPDLVYIRDSTSGTLKSPLWEYHNSTFLDSWREGITVDETVNRYIDPVYNEINYSDIVKSTMVELKNREELADIKITDFIEKNLSFERMFYTFNHPSNHLMAEMCQRIFSKLGIEVDGLKYLDGEKEALDKIVVPVNKYSSDALHIKFDDPLVFKGVECFMKNDGQIVLQNKRVYQLQEIVKKYFEIYDKNLSREVNSSTFKV